MCITEKSVMCLTNFLVKSMCLTEKSVRHMGLDRNILWIEIFVIVRAAYDSRYIDTIS